MRKLMFIALAVFIAACQSNENSQQEADSNSVNEMTDEQLTGSFGAEISEDGAMSLAELKNKMSGQAEVNAKLTGTITECCQTKGCWMTIENPDGDDIRVTFKDYGFFVPKGCAGKTVVMAGKAYYDTVSVDVLKHYAEDAGKSQEEIEAITEPVFDLAFEAEGVIIK